VVATYTDVVSIFIHAQLHTRFADFRLLTNLNVLHLDPHELLETTRCSRTPICW